MKHIVSTLVLGLLLASCTIGIVRREEFEIRLTVESPIPTATFQPLASPTPEPLSGQAWRIETINDNARDGGSLALDSCGYPHISYLRDNPAGYYDITYAHWTGSQWLIEKAADAEFGDSAALALDGSASPHVAYIACNPNYCAIRYARRTGDEWAVTDWDIAGGVPSLAIDANGRPHASYRRSHQGVHSSLEYAYWTGSGWLTETLDSGGGSFDYSALKLDSDGHPHISYYGADDLRYAHWTGDEWTLHVIDNTTYTGQYTSLALDNDDHPHISYYDWTNEDLKYAVWTGSAWNIQTVDSAGSVGRLTSLALDTYGHPHIAYHDDTYRAVKYARWTGKEWQMTVIETDVGDGDTISLALDGENQPHLSYYYYNDLGEHVLKYATTSSVLTPSDIPCVPAVSLPADVPAPTPAPSPTPTDAPPLPTEEASSGPIIHYFRADVEEVDPGGTIVFEWASEGATEVTLLHKLDEDWTQSEIELDLSGTFAYEISDYQADQHAAFHLCAQDKAGHTTIAAITITVRCADPWFFAPPPGGCPSPPSVSEAAEQHFEYGTMIWVEMWDSEENKVLVLYDDDQIDPRWASYPDEWEEDDPDRDPTLNPPPGLYQPVRGFGLVWRQNSDVRDRLGWAVNQETGFSTIIQHTQWYTHNSTYMRALDGNVWYLNAEQSKWEKIQAED